MIVGITNSPRDYSWGSRTAIAEILGREASGAPEAELWFGTHPGSPSRLVGDQGTLASLVAPDRVPFLLKVLAAEAPLSLQAHPTSEQAEGGFARENAAGIALDSAERNYKDPFHKPELLFALSDPFRALCGFRDVAATRELLAPLSSDPRVAPLLARLTDDSSLREAFEWLIAGGDDVAELIDAVIAYDSDLPEWTTARELASAYPGDPGIAISLLLNNVSLAPGDVIYLPAGNIHAYLEGAGIELMAASDNVLRGGLTTKRIDVPELSEVLDFRPQPVPYLRPVEVAPGLRSYRPGVPEFELVHCVLDAEVGSASVSLNGPAIALCVGGEVTVTGANSSAALRRGESVYASADESTLSLEGTGTVFIATTSA